jgi:hypothetical protein
MNGEMTFGMIVAAAAIALSLATAAAKADCLSYTHRVTVSGTLTRQVFAGKPNFTSVARGDKAETYFVLRLDQPVCVDANPAYPKDMVAMADILDMQLILYQPQFQQLRRWLGKHVVLQGSLDTATTGHHHTPVILSDVVMGGDTAATLRSWTEGGDRASKDHPERSLRQPYQRLDLMTKVHLS